MLNQEAALRRQLADAEALPDECGERPAAFYEVLEALAVFYVRAERLDDARSHWDRLWQDHPGTCWTKDSFEQFAYVWFYYDGEDPDDAYL